jgi:hypothetical protein
VMDMRNHSPHLGDDEIEELQNGRAPLATVLAASAHAQECAQCAARLDALSLRKAQANFAGALQPEALDEHPGPAMLTRFVDGQLPADEADRVAAHATSCPICREDIADLRTVRDPEIQHRPRLAPARTRWARSLGAIAAALIAVVGIGILIHTMRSQSAPPRGTVQQASTHPGGRVTPVPSQASGYGHAEWDRLVADAVASGRLTLPAAEIAALQGIADSPRGHSDGSSAPLAPTGAVIETTTPHFRWPRVEGGAYLVALFAGEREVARSGVLRSTEWMPPVPLERGRTYQWEVRVTTPRGDETLPPPAQPPARFAILGEAAHRELAEARERFAHDPLLLGVLYAKHGLAGCAAAELRAAPPAPGVPSLLEQATRAAAAEHVVDVCG